MNIREVTISRLREYENNPRNNDLAVEKVHYSIERFGFLFPIIVDQNYVIVAGHTRVRACRELGIQTVPCIVIDELTEEQVNFFRLVDNKTSEYSDWDFEKLKNELSMIDLTLDKNQLLLDRFELSAEVFDIEPEQAEIKIPTYNFMGVDKPKTPTEKIVSVSTIITGENTSDKPKEDTPAPLTIDNTSAESHDAEAAAATHNESVESVSAKQKDAQSASRDAEVDAPKKKAPTLIQFRFGDVQFFISQIELNRLNARYTEYVDSGEVLKRSFADYLLEGVENYD